MRRQLTQQERDVIRSIAEGLDDNQRRRVLEDAALAMAEVINDDNSIIRFHLDNYVRPPYRGQHSLPVEGRVQDADGASLLLLLHQDENDRLYELELVRFEDGPVKGPRWETLKLFTC